MYVLKSCTHVRISMSVVTQFSIYEIRRYEMSGTLINGTVKEQSEYKGDKQTVLTRCKIKEAA